MAISEIVARRSSGRCGSGAWLTSEVLLDDLTTVDLDVAALAAGYARPATAPGYRPEIQVVARSGLARRLLAWR